MEKKVVNFPGSLKSFLNVAVPQYSEAGLSGATNYAWIMNRIGESLASGKLNDDELEALLFPFRPGTANHDSDPQLFWTEVYRELFGRLIEVPPVPEKKLRTKMRAAAEKYQMLLVFIPAVSEDEYPTCFVKSNWGKYISDVSKIERRALPGRWVLVDTTPKPNWDDKSGYQDRLTKDLDLTTRFNTSWNDCENVLLPKFAKLMGLSRKAVRLMTAEEWNFIANLFNWLRLNRSMNLPDLGATVSVEWCDNGIDTEFRLYIGSVGDGGLANVDCGPATSVGGSIGCRFLAVL